MKYLEIKIQAATYKMSDSFINYSEYEKYNRELVSLKQNKLNKTAIMIKAKSFVGKQFNFHLSVYLFIPVIYFL